MKKYLSVFLTLLLFSSCDFIADKMGYTPKSNDYNLGVTIKQEEPKESAEEAKKREYRDNIGQYVYLETRCGFSTFFQITNKTPYTIDKVVIKLRKYDSSRGFYYTTESYNYIKGNSYVDIPTQTDKDAISLESIKCSALGMY